jgi:hypothetical protein
VARIYHNFFRSDAVVACYLIANVLDESELQDTDIYANQDYETARGDLFNCERAHPQVAIQQSGIVPVPTTGQVQVLINLNVSTSAKVAGEQSRSAGCD